MSHVIAYRCDVCGVVKEESETVGIALNQDMFDSMNSFKMEPKHQEKVPAHYCLLCYEEYVLNPVRVAVDRKRDEPGYVAKLRELQYNLRKITVLKFNENTKKRFSNDCKYKLKAVCLY